jgi:hypothetical protein
VNGDELVLFHTDPIFGPYEHAIAVRSQICAGIKSFRHGLRVAKKEQVMGHSYPSDSPANWDSWSHKRQFFGAVLRKLRTVNGLPRTAP